MIEIHRSVTAGSVSGTPEVNHTAIAVIILVLGKCTAYKYPGWCVISTRWKSLFIKIYHINSMMICKKKHDWNTLISHRSVCVCQVLLKWITLQLLSYILFQESALHIAAQNGDLNWVKFLVDEKSDVNRKDKNGVSKRHWLFRIADVYLSSPGLCLYLPTSIRGLHCMWQREGAVSELWNILLIKGLLSTSKTKVEWVF